MKPTRGCFLTDEQVNAIQIVLEQIEGCADLLDSHVDGLASNNGAKTAVNVIKEKARAADALITAGYKFYAESVNKARAK